MRTWSSGAIDIDSGGYRTRRLLRSDFSGITFFVNGLAARVHFGSFEFYRLVADGTGGEMKFGREV